MMFIASVMQRLDPVGEWTAFFRRQMDEWGVVLGPDGTWSYMDGSLGMWEFIPVEEARQRFAGAAWLEARSGCPFVGETLGFFAWECWFTSDLDWFSETLGEENRNIAIPALKEGRGVLARLDDGQFGQAVQLKRLSLAQAAGKYSMDDGAEWLSLDEPEYVQAVRREVNRCMRQADREDDAPWWHDTHHNPLQWHSETGTQGVPTWEEAQAMMIEVWVYDFALLDGEMFRGVHF